MLCFLLRRIFSPYLCIVDEVGLILLLVACTVFSARRAASSQRCALYSARCALSSKRCVVSSVRYAISSACRDVFSTSQKILIFLNLSKRGRVIFQFRVFEGVVRIITTYRLNKI